MNQAGCVGEVIEGGCGLAESPKKRSELYTAQIDLPDRVSPALQLQAAVIVF